MSETKDHKRTLSFASVISEPSQAGQANLKSFLPGSPALRIGQYNLSGMSIQSHNPSTSQRLPPGEWHVDMPTMIRLLYTTDKKATDVIFECRLYRDGRATQEAEVEEWSNALTSSIVGFGMGLMSDSHQGDVGHVCCPSEDLDAESDSRPSHPPSVTFKTWGMAPGRRGMGLLLDPTKRRSQPRSKGARGAASETRLLMRGQGEDEGSDDDSEEYWSEEEASEDGW